jgi:PAS domain S-box-containing protein
MAGRRPTLPADRALVAVLPVPAVLTSDGWHQGGATILFANREFCRLTGYKPGELAGKNTRLLHGPRTDVSLLRAGRPAGGRAEGWLYRKDGAEFYGRWEYRPVTGRRGPVVVVYQDHTEHWRQREALLHSQKLGTVGLLAGGVAHDFNNLLSVINGYCEIVEPKVAAVPAARKDVHEIHRAGLKASAIARQILEFSRRRDSETGVINFNTLIREIAEIIRRVCGDAIEVELRLSSDLGNARINPVHFQQVLLNLCFNARDAMPGGGRLTLRTFNRHTGTADGHYQVVLTVADTGAGIAPSLHQKIFEPFYTTKSHGTGLGLPTAQALIRQAGGDLTVESGGKAGTVFTVLLPETAEPENSGPAALGVLPSTQGTEAVIVIEQDEGLRKMISGILVIDGYTVVEAPTVEEIAGRSTAPQLVIADTSARRGLDCLQQLCAAHRGLRVISTAIEPAALAGLAQGSVAHLPKPFALSSLLTKARELLDVAAKP